MLLEVISCMPSAIEYLGLKLLTRKTAGVT